MEELKTNLISLLGQCVLGNVTFQGTIGGVYDTSDITNGTLTLNSIKSLALKLNKQIESADSQDLFEEGENKVNKILLLQRDTLVAYVKYVNAKADIAKKAAQTRKDNAAKLQMLKKLKQEKELTALGSQSLEDLDKMIAELEE